MTRYRPLYTAPLPPRTGTEWALVSDRVMGGVSEGTLSHARLVGRPALRLSGEVRVENGGGFVQMALDLAPGRTAVDSGAWDGMALRVRGDGACYNLHLRTEAVAKPWQSYRARFRAGPDWRLLHVPWSQFTAHRIAAAFDPAALTRIGLVAIGDAGPADLALSGLAFYADFVSDGSSAS